MSDNEERARNERPKVPTSIGVQALRSVDEALKTTDGNAAADEITLRAYGRMKEPEQARFNRHKSICRGMMMKIFTETMLPEHWTNVDDVAMDNLVAWMVGLQSRAGTTAKNSPAGVQSQLTSEQV